MKKIYIYLAAFAVTLGLGSCNLDVQPEDNIDTTDAYKTLTDVRNGLNGAYYALGYYPFLGNYAVAIGDMSAGLSNGSGSSGHFYSFSSWTIDDTQSELEDVWNYGYKVIDRTTRTINGATAVLANESLHLGDGDKANAELYIGQSYGLRALSYYYLVNLFSLPYSATNASTQGLKLITDKTVEPFESVKRSTLQQTYDQIVADIENAEKSFESADNSFKAAESNSTAKSALSAYYFGPMALQALKARVYMCLGDYATAEAAAKKAIEIKGKGDGKYDDKQPSDESYISMWTSTAITDEDIFTIVKSDNDNLSANALNTLYNSYYCTITDAVTEALGVDQKGNPASKDIRWSLVRENSDGAGLQPAKFDGTPTSQAVSNIPIFRKSEMSLIIAECEARIGSLATAKDYLLYTAKRNPDNVAVVNAITNKDDLLKFISEERIREFFAEGHRFYDTRRMGEKITIPGATQPWDIQKFVFPIPAGEVNSGAGITQNDGWENNIPQ